MGNMPFITQGKTNLKYILIIVILAAIVSGGILGYYYLWIKDLEAKLAELELKLSPKVIEDEIANWKTYRNKEYGFEINYPPGWEVQKRDSLIGFGTEKCIWITIAENTQNLEIEQYYEETYKDFLERECLEGLCSCFRNKEFTLVTVGNREALQCEIVPGTLPSTATLVSDSDFVFGIWKIYSNYEAYKGPCLLLNTDKIYDQMLSTFRFLE
jgi:hypothetical protein